MHVLLAQTEAELAVCTAEDGAVSLLCRWIYRLTDNELLAQSGTQLGVVVRIVVLLVVAYLLSRVARAAISRFAQTMERRIEARLDRDERRGTLDVARYRSRRFQRLRAITGVLRGAVGALVWTVALVAVLEVLGISIQPILAGAGLAGVVIGFGAQQLIRDVLAGISMLIEDQFGVGDWIDVDGTMGQVQRVGLRVTSFRDLDGIQWHVQNGVMQRVGNLSQEWSRSLLDVPLALDADVPAAKALIFKVATDLRTDPVWGQDIIDDPEIWGVQDFGPNGLSIRVSMLTKPMTNWDINRQMRERLHHAFEQAGIRMQGQLVELGGMPRGYPVATTTDDGSRVSASTRRRKGLVPADVTPLDQPPPRPTPSIDEVETSEAYDDEQPDHTAELRLQRGREPRPD